MDYFTMKTLHLISIVALVISFGVLIVGCFLEGKNSLRKWGFIFHVISWLAVFSTAFGLVGLMNLSGENFPNWGRAKTLAWLLLGFGVFFVKRRPKLVGIHLAVVFILCSVAVALAVYKPSL